MQSLLCAALIGGPMLMNSFAAPIAGPEPKPELTEECRQAFAWMTNLGYPETKDLKFVLVATGHWSQHENDAPVSRFQYGFLMEEKGDAFQSLEPDPGSAGVRENSLPSIKGSPKP